jgi:hypothetical protein
MPAEGGGEGEEMQIYLGHHIVFYAVQATSTKVT